MLHWALALAIVATVLATIALALAVVTYRNQRKALASPPRSLAPRPAPYPVAARAPEASALPGPAALVVNPSKVADVDSLIESARTASLELGLPDPLVFLTTVQDPGHSQAEEAVRAGASVVVAVGGDGTVREVASALLNSGVPMGLIPAGTGNLLARNLDLPIDSPSLLMQTALSGRDMPIDAGIMRIVPPPATYWENNDDDAPAPRDETAAEDEPTPAPSKHLFLVLAGVGFDAATMADTDEDLKRRVGWAAYLVRSAPHLVARRTRLAMQVGNGAWRNYRLRTLLFANVGRLPAGIVLLPDAEIDDGYLDIAAIDTRRWLFGWVSVTWRVMLQGLGFRPRRLPFENGSIEFFRGRSARVALDQPEPVQVDGDVVGEAIELAVKVAPGALVVRVR